MNNKKFDVFYKDKWGKSFLISKHETPAQAARAVGSLQRKQRNSDIKYYWKENQSKKIRKRK